MNDHIIVCSGCCTLTNATSAEFSKQLLCSDCTTPLLPEEPIEVTGKILQRFITHCTLPLLVEFWGTWSGVSHEMADTLNSLADTFKRDVLFLRLNSEQEQVFANQYNLTDIPTCILFVDGFEYHRLQGSVSEFEFHKWLERYLRIKRKKATHHPSSV